MLFLDDSIWKITRGIHSLLKKDELKADCGYLSFSKDTYEVETISTLYFNFWHI